MLNREIKKFSLYNALLMTCCTLAFLKEMSKIPVHHARFQGRIRSEDLHVYGYTEMSCRCQFILFTGER